MAAPYATICSITLAILFLLPAVRAQAHTCSHNQKSDENPPELRITRGSNQGELRSLHAFPPGLSQRFLRRLANPSFCPHLLCHGSCADLFGGPTLMTSDPGRAWQDTPCSLPRFRLPGTADNYCSPPP